MIFILTILHKLTKKNLAIMMVGCLFFILSEKSTAQTFCKTIGGVGSDVAKSIIQTTDGGYAILGTTNSFGQGSADCYMVKLDAIGGTQWTRTIGGIDIDQGNAIIQTVDGGYAIAGTSGTAANRDLYIIKLDIVGIIQWTRKIGGISNDQGFSITQTSDGGFAVGGAIRIGSASKAYVVKLNTIGTVLWTRSITVGFGSDLSGIGIVEANDGGIVIGNVKFGVAKFDSTGTLLWSKTIQRGLDFSSTLIKTVDGGYLITGRSLSFSSGTGNDFYMVKIDSLGTVVWTRAIGSVRNDWGFASATTSDGGYVLAGRTDFGGTNGDVYVVKLDSTGTFQWSRTMGGAGLDQAASIIQTTDGGYALTGETDSYGQGGSDFFIAKLDTLGNSCCSVISDGGNIDSVGVITVTGTLNIETNFTGSGGVIGSGGIEGVVCLALPIELLSFNALNEGESVKTIWSTASEINNDFFTILRSKDAVNFEPIGTAQGAGNSNAQLNYVFYDDAPYDGISYYQLKQTDFDGTSSYSDIVSVNREEINGINVYPNPAYNTIHIELKNNEETTVEIINSIGQIVYQENFNTIESNSLQIDISKIPKGVYFLKTNTLMGKPYNKKIIKK